MFFAAILLFEFIYAQNCFTQNVEYIGTSLSLVSNVDSANVCQQLCQENPLCKFFSHNTVTQECNLLPSSATARDAENFISGPKTCECAIHLKEDVIFFMDYSGSISPHEWEQETNFASELTRYHLPPDTRVAAMGFGNVPYDARDFYFGFDGSSLERNADRLATQKRRVKGATHFEPGLQYLIDGSPYLTAPINWAENTDRKRMLIIITDGQPSYGDQPCRKRPALLALDIITIIVGVGSDFKQQYIECLVEDPKTDIFTTQSFDSISDVIDKITTQICKSDIDIEVSEIRSSTGNMFIEMVNVGKRFNGSDINIKSNLLIGDAQLDPVWIEENEVIVVGENPLEDCSPPCRFFRRTMNNQLYQNYWYAQVFETFGDQSLTLDEIYQDSTYVTIDSSLYSWELKRLSYDNSLSGNWRRSCKKGGSPGKINEVTCTVVCTEGSCGPNPPNVCHATSGCECSPVGYYQEQSMCPIIPAPLNCTASGYPGDVGVTVRWKRALTDTVYGYRVTSPISSTDIWDTSRNEFTVSSENMEDWKKIKVATIGLAEQQDTGYTATRFSQQASCELIVITVPPTESPTTPSPTRRPTQPQPVIYLSLDYDSNNRPLPIAITTLQTLSIGIRLSYGHYPFALNTSWEFRNSLGELQDTGFLVFPEHAYDTHQDLMKVRPKFNIVNKTENYVFRLLATTEKDASGRDKYSIASPSEVDVAITEQSPANNNGNTSVADNMDWWAWLLVAIAVIALVFGFFIARYKIADLREKWQHESDVARQYSQDLLMHEEGGLLGVPTDQVFINPLHNANIPAAGVGLVAPETDAQMIFLTEESDFSLSKKSFEQTEGPTRAPVTLYQFASESYWF